MKVVIRLVLDESYFPPDIFATYDNPSCERGARKGSSHFACCKEGATVAGLGIQPGACIATAPHVTAVDPVGAGDAFKAGLITCYLHGTARGSQPTERLRQAAGYGSALIFYVFLVFFFDTEDFVLSGET